MSFGRQEPPYPGPAFKNSLPILGSNPIIFAISSILVPGILKLSGENNKWGHFYGYFRR